MMGKDVILSAIISTLTSVGHRFDGIINAGSVALASKSLIFQQSAEISSFIDIVIV